jgi:hypothetical protein
MKGTHILLGLGVLGIFCSMPAKAAKQQLIASQTPAVQAAAAIQSDIYIPLKALEHKNKNPLVGELAGIAQDLFRLSMNKIAVKYDAFVQSFKSFEPGLQGSENKVAYLETWIALAQKRVSKLTVYSERLEKIQVRLAGFDKKLELLKGSDDALSTELGHYSAQLKEKITMTNEWIAKSRKVFSVQLNKLQSRETKFKKARVPQA